MANNFWLTVNLKIVMIRASVWLMLPFYDAYYIKIMHYLMGQKKYMLSNSFDFFSNFHSLPP